MGRSVRIDRGRRLADASATNVRVPLDQWLYNSFVIKDGERSKSFKDLVAVYLLPYPASV